MRTTRLGLLLAVPVLLAGCGDVGGTSGQPSSPGSGCGTGATSGSLARLDLDGDGTAEEVAFSPADGSCPASLSATVAGRPEHAPTGPWDPQPTARDASVIAIPGRVGQVLVLRQQHPRGGFQARLFGYADGRFSELRADGRAVVPFVATDVAGSPLATTCVQGGLAVTEAVEHRPIGVLPAWDVVRTTYAVDGNAVTKQGSAEVADNVLDPQLQRQYADLVSHSLFANCLVAR